MWSPRARSTRWAAAARSGASARAADRQQAPVPPDSTCSDQIACSSFQPVALSLTHVPNIETWLPTVGIGSTWLGITSVMRAPALTPFNRPVNPESGRTLMWQSPSCSTWCAATVPVIVRHGLPPSSTVSCPGRCTPTSGLDGQLPPDGAGAGAGAGGAGHACVLAVLLAIGDALPLA